MEADYKKEFISFAMDEGVLRFGEFTLKSGRISPYFFNAGEFNTGGALARLGEYYAHALVASQIPHDALFGPAYKGIPLVAALSIAMSQCYQSDLPYTFNRKEAKDHGEGGLMVGAPMQGRYVIVDDVITAGTAIREVMSLFDQAPSATIAGVMVAIDRQEKGQGELSAIEEVEQNDGIKVISVVNLDDIVEYLREDGSFQQELKQIGSYRRQYGIASGL